MCFPVIYILFLNIEINAEQRYPTRSIWLNFITIRATYTILICYSFPQFKHQLCFLRQQTEMWHFKIVWIRCQIHNIFEIILAGSGPCPSCARCVCFVIMKWPCESANPHAYRLGSTTFIEHQCTVCSGRARARYIFRDVPRIGHQPSCFVLVFCPSRTFHQNRKRSISESYAIRISSEKIVTHPGRTLNG